jgi:translation initiation factor 6 (eIF-6)
MKTTPHTDHIPHTVHVQGEAQSHRFRQRVLRARIAAFEAQAGNLLGQLSACNRQGLLAESDRLEANLTDRIREALRLKTALETGAPLVDVVAPRLAWS